MTTYYYFMNLEAISDKDRNHWLSSQAFNSLFMQGKASIATTKRYLQRY